jgi:hypothetical protein
MLGIGTVIAAAAAAIVLCTVLFASIIGVSSLLTSGPSEVPSLWQRALLFGMTFGLLSAAHWGLGGSRRQVGEDRTAMLVVKVLAVALAAVGIGLAFTGGRWAQMFGGIAGAGVVLVVAWMVLTQLVSKAVEKRAPTEKPAGAS